MLPVARVTHNKQHIKPTILVVDDTPLNIDVLKGLLHDQYIVRPAISGELALRLVNIEPLPSLILLDIMMPEMDGYEVCRRLKANPRTCDIPVIFITAESSMGNEIHGLELGAVDFLGKPIVPAIVLARISTHLTLQATRRELQEKNIILGEEKELLEDIVGKMRNSTPFDGQHTRYIQFALERTAGDIILSAYRPDGTQHVLVGDFSGHGLPAALGGTMVPYIFYRMTEENCNMHDILKEINRVLFIQLPTQLYMAASIVEISADRNMASIWNYGLPTTFAFINNQIEHIPSSGLPLGISTVIENFEPHQRFAIQTGDVIYLYTDGVTEATSPQNEQFGSDRLEALAKNIHQQQLELDTLWRELDIHCAGMGLTDDAVLVEVSA